MPERQVRSIAVSRPGRAMIIDDTEPEPGPGQAWVATEWSGISAGTEVALVRGTDPQHQRGWDPDLRAFGISPVDRYPKRGLGYMEVGRVTESRTDVLAVGSLVAMAYGHRTGACADPTRTTVIPVPDDLDPLLGIYLAQMGPICVNGLLHAAAALGGPQAGIDAGVRAQHVLVVGAGVVGLLSALLAVRHGAAEVCVADSSAERRAVAEALGLVAVDDADGRAWLAIKQRWRHGPGDAGADVVLQCRGHDAALATALKALRPQGVVVDLGFYQAGAEAVRLGEEFHHNGLALICAQIGRVPRGMSATWPRPALAAVTLDLLRERGEDIRTHLVTDVVPFEDGPRLLTDMAERRLASPPLQAVLHFPLG
ncbi:zinc-binding dehydrogenase [Modestobacter excelsi]|uniref:zinc-binding dehydrogenase n=1 Tax=Modestobacter excelsi TaxID=2213161 RepID=UPI00110D2362|nr:zinc-binding dehydrogenase [Modestobacter excelsi]